MLGRKQKENYVGGGEVSLLCHSRLRVKKGKKSNHSMKLGIQDSCKIKA